LNVLGETQGIALPSSFFLGVADRPESITPLEARRLAESGISADASQIRLPAKARAAERPLAEAYV